MIPTEPLEAGMKSDDPVDNLSGGLIDGQEGAQPADDALLDIALELEDAPGAVASESWLQEDAKEALLCGEADEEEYYELQEDEAEFTATDAEEHGDQEEQA